MVHSPRTLEAVQEHEQQEEASRERRQAQELDMQIARCCREIDATLEKEDDGSPRLCFRIDDKVDHPDYLDEALRKAEAKYENAGWVSARIRTDSDGFSASWLSITLDRETEKA